MYIFVFICVYVCMYMYMYICIYMYVNTHTTQTLPTQEAFKKEMRGERAAWSLPKGTAVTARLEPSRAADALNLVLSTSHDTFLRAALVFGERVFAGAGVCAIYIYIYIYILHLVLSTSDDTFLRAALVFGERVFAGAGVCAIYIYIYIYIYVYVYIYIYMYIYIYCTWSSLPRTTHSCGPPWSLESAYLRAQVCVYLYVA